MSNSSNNVHGVLQRWAPTKSHNPPNALVALVAKVLTISPELPLSSNSMPKYLKEGTLSKLQVSIDQTGGAAESPTTNSLLFCWLILKWCWLQKAAKARNMVPNSYRDGARSTTSSANNKITSTMERNCKRCLWGAAPSLKASSTTLSTRSKKIENSKGEHGQPCFNPRNTLVCPASGAPANSISRWR